MEISSIKATQNFIRDMQYYKIENCIYRQYSRIFIKEIIIKKMYFFFLLFWLKQITQFSCNLPIDSTFTKSSSNIKNIFFIEFIFLNQKTNFFVGAIFFYSVVRRLWIINYPEPKCLYF